ncbi:MAG: hypothetical protein KC434_09970, partial [Anaerolineales bacterium]|nr:hypothetical protein [Anaerolineales bacterium]
EQIPLTPNGKIAYAQLPQPQQSALLAQSSYAPPTDALENQLVNIWEAVLDIRPIGIHDNYFEMGGQSLQTIALFAQIEKVLKRNIPLATIFQAPTVAKLAEVMRQNGATETWSSLVPISPSGSKRPFFCVHGGAGHVYHYRALAQHLGSDQPFYGLQPGKEQEHPKDDVKAMAAVYLKEIRKLQPNGPYSVGGFCFGAIIAFEMAQQLTEMGETVALVALIDAIGPGYNGQVIPPAALPTLEELAEASPQAKRPQSLLEKGRRVGANWLRRLHGAKVASQRRLRHIGKARDRLLIQIYEKLERPLPHHLHNYQMLAASRTARKRYEPEVYSGDLAVFRREDVDNAIPADMGWDRLTTQTVKVYEIPGTHLELLQEPYVQELAQQLQLSMREDA